MNNENFGEEEKFEEDEKPKPLGCFLRGLIIVLAIIGIITGACSLILIQF